MASFRFDEFLAVFYTLFITLAILLVANMVE